MGDGGMAIPHRLHNAIGRKNAYSVWKRSSPPPKAVITSSI